MKEKYVTVCPKCNSTHVYADFSNIGAVATGMINSFKKCDNCGFTSSIFPEMIKSEIPKVKKIKDVEKRQLAQPIYTTGVSTLWKFTGPLLILLMLILYFYSEFKFVSMLILPSSIMYTLYGFKKELRKEKWFRYLFILSIFLPFIGWFII